MFRNACKKDGYVLLAVLSVSILMVTLLGLFANLSLRRGLEAADAERDLQQRWGARTLQHAVLTQAPALFEKREEVAFERTPGTPPPPFFRAAVTLGDVTFDLLLGDEDAKVHLNSLYHQSGEKAAADAVGSLVDSAATRSLRLLPATESWASNRVDEESELGPPPAFRSWGEVFDFAQVRTDFGTTAAIPNITTGTTCWGSGQLNFRRASDEAILAVARSVIQDGSAKRLLERYRDSPTATLSILLQTEVDDPEDRRRLARLFSESSSHYSIWIDASTRGRRPLRLFVVQDRDPAGDLRHHHFQF